MRRKGVFFAGLASVAWDVLGCLLSVHRHAPFFAVAFGVLAVLSAGRNDASGIATVTDNATQLAEQWRGRASDLRLASIRQHHFCGLFVSSSVSLYIPYICSGTFSLKTTLEVHSGVSRQNLVQCDFPNSSL